MIVRVFFLLSMLLFHQGNIYAQPLMAKLKFEDAEKAYQAGEYDKTLSLVTEVEKMLNGTSPKTMYLRILASEKKGISDFATLSALRKNCSEYLNKYGALQELEDQYREVYEIQKRLDQFPATKEAFDLSRQNEAQEIELRKKTLALKDKIAAYVKAPIKLGMKREEIPQSIISTMWETTTGAFLSRYNSTLTGVKYLLFDSLGTLICYHYCYSSKKSDFSGQLKEYELFESDFNLRFNVVGAVESKAQRFGKDGSKYADLSIYETDYQRLVKTTYTIKDIIDYFPLIRSISVESKYKLDGYIIVTELGFEHETADGKKLKTEDYYQITEKSYLITELIKY